MDGEIEVGSLRDSSFVELFNGPRMTQYRIWHLLGQFEEMPKCVQCGGINFHKLTPEEVKAWLDQIGRPELYSTYLERLKDPP